MVRTKADNCARKAVAAKAPRKNLGASGSGIIGATSMKSPAGKKSKFSGGNSACPRRTPDWQKEITNFMIRPPGSSKPTRHKENIDPEDDGIEEEINAAGCSHDDSMEASASGSGRTEKDVADQDEDGSEEDENDVGDKEKAESSSAVSSSKPSFTKNNCIDDDSDDDY